MGRIEIDSGTIHYESAGPEHGRPVVFVHGYWMGGQVWHPVSRRLADRGLRCIAPTWPMGAHSQPLRPGADRTITGVAGIVAEALAALDLRTWCSSATTPAVSSRSSSPYAIPNGSEPWC